MLSKSTIKLINSLQLKKYRIEHQLFFVEGRKSVMEVLDSTYEILKLITTEKFANQYLQKFENKNIKIEFTDEENLSKLGNFDSNNAILAVVNSKKSKPENINNNTILALDNIQDPGNLGTIIRTADWFGVTDIICSPNTVDMYNPKVVAACMGSFVRMNIQYCDLVEKIAYLKNQKFEILGAFMEGEQLQSVTSKKSVIVMGNEAQGISENLFDLIDKKITINGSGTTESLNVAVATGIILQHFCKN